MEYFKVCILRKVDSYKKKLEMQVINYNSEKCNDVRRNHYTCRADSYALRLHFPLSEKLISSNLLIKVNLPCGGL